MRLKKLIGHFVMITTECRQPEGYYQRTTVYRNGQYIGMSNIDRGESGIGRQQAAEVLKANRYQVNSMTVNSWDIVKGSHLHLYNASTNWKHFSRKVER